MSNLEDIVPPLELCKQIPFPKFEDSVFIWERKNDWILQRTNMDCDLEEEGYYVPAPTLEEIIKAIKTKTYCKDDLCNHKYDLHYCAIDLKWIFCFGENFAVADTLSSVALKLWLELNKEGNEK